MKKNEEGLTLIEVLATLTILSIASVVIWQVFLQGYEYSNKAVSKNRLTQEANIVITQLNRIHQTNDQYKINSSDGVIKILDSNDQPITVFNSTQFDFEARLDESEIKDQTIYPSKAGNGDLFNDLLIELEISDKNSSNLITIETYLYRLKDDERNE